MGPPRQPVDAPEDTSAEANVDYELGTSYLISGGNGLDCIRDDLGLSYLFPSGTSLKDCIHSSLLKRSISPESYFWLTQRVFFPDLEESSQLYPKDLEYLKGKKPVVFKPPSDFKALYDLCVPFIVNKGECPLPTRGKWPFDIYTYIIHATTSLYVIPFLW